MGYLDDASELIFSTQRKVFKPYNVPPVPVGQVAIRSGLLRAQLCVRDLVGLHQPLQIALLRAHVRSEDAVLLAEGDMGEKEI